MYYYYGMADYHTKGVPYYHNLLFIED